jgi:hypothetical protein
MNAVTALKRVAKKLELVALVLFKLVIVPLVELRFVAVTPVADAVVKYAWPDTVRLVVEAFVVVRDVNVGFADTPMVEVPVKTMFDPALK